METRIVINAFQLAFQYRYMEDVMTLNEYVLKELADMKQTLITALEDLPEKDLVSMEPCGHWPIAWIAMHLSSGLDMFINYELTGKMTVEHEARMQAWPLVVPTPEDTWPSLETLLGNWNKVMDKAMENVAALGEDGMQKVGGHLSAYGFNQPIIELIQMMVSHHHTHMRNLWCILGERRVDTKWDEPKMEE
jgi:hypothetical protein